MREEQVKIKRPIKDTLEQFFFAKSDGTAEGLFRIGYALVLFADLLCQYGKLELLYSNQGLRVGPIDGWYTPLIDKTVYFIWLATLIALALGVLTRWVSILNYLILFYFFALTPAFVGHGADWVYFSMGFYLMFMTADRKFAMMVSSPESWGNTRAIWPLRLGQINFLFIYFGAGVAKLFDLNWLNGSAMELVFQHPLIIFDSAHWMASSSGLLMLATYLTILWQLLAPTALFSRKIRVFYVLTALFFHVMIDLSMRVGWFSELMLVSLFLFSDDVAFYLKKWRGAPTEKANGEDAAPATEPVRPLSRNFLIVYLAIFLLTQTYFFSLACGEPLKVLRIPASYSAAVTGNRPYDLVSTLEKVLFVVFEVVDRNGKRTFLPPMDSDGAFAPAYKDVKEIRRGLLMLKFASRPITQRGWRSLLKYELLPKISELKLAYPVRIEGFGIRERVADVPRPFNANTVPKTLIFAATVQSPDGEVAITIPDR